MKTFYIEEVIKDENDHTPIHSENIKVESELSSPDNPIASKTPDIIKNKIDLSSKPAKIIKFGASKTLKSKVITLSVQNNEKMASVLI